MAREIFDAAGFHDGVYQMPEQIDLAAEWILANMDELQTMLPKYVLGNVHKGLRGEFSRRCLMGFMRRLAHFLNGAVLSKRIQFQKDGRNTSKYMYKIVV